MKTVASPPPKIPAQVEQILERAIGEHGSFTYRSLPGGGSVVARHTPRDEHSKPTVKTLREGLDAVALKKRLYRAEKALNLRDALVGALAVEKFDFDTVNKLARKLAKQAPKGGWPATEINLSGARGLDWRLDSVVNLAKLNIVQLLNASQGEYPEMSPAVRDQLRMLMVGLEKPASFFKDAKAKARAEEASTGATIATPRTTGKDKDFQGERLSRLQREEAVWMHVRHRIFNNDPEIDGAMGRLDVIDAGKRLATVRGEMQKLGGTPKWAEATQEGPLPAWGVNDMGMVVETIRVLKKRLAAEQLEHPNAGRQDEKETHAFAKSPVTRLMDLTKKYQAIHARLSEAQGGSLTSRTARPAERLNGGPEHMLKELNRQFLLEAATIRNYERGVGGVSRKQCCEADIRMDGLADQIVKLESGMAASAREVLDGRTSSTTTTTSSTVPITTTTTTLPTTTTTTTSTFPTTMTTATTPPTPRNS